MAVIAATESYLHSSAAGSTLEALSLRFMRYIEREPPLEIALQTTRTGAFTAEIVQQGTTCASAKGFLIE